MERCLYLDGMDIFDMPCHAMQTKRKGESRSMWCLHEKKNANGWWYFDALVTPVQLKGDGTVIVAANRPPRAREKESERE